MIRFGCCLLFCVPLLFTSGCSAKEIRVYNEKQLYKSIKCEKRSCSGKTIIVASGKYEIDKPLIINYSNLKIIGADRDKVILNGGGMKDGAMHIFLVKASDFRLENLTLGWVRNHGVQVRGEKNADRIVIRNVRFVDCYEQLLKVSYDPKDLSVGSDDGLVENCLFEYSSGIGPQWYIGGVDAHNSHNWVVRNNVFKHIRSPEKRLAEHAIHFWSSSSGTIVENNRITNCDRGIGFGLGQRGHSGGSIHNNMVHTTRDVGIGLESASSVNVLHNSVFTQNYPNSIEVRFPTQQANRVEGNLVNGRIAVRNGGSIDLGQNFIVTNSDIWKQPWIGDLHLKYADDIICDPLPTSLSVDFDGDCREPLGANWGADVAEVCKVPVD